MNRVLIICGPTATGKTKFGINLAKALNGEIISADSRQVYIGKNIIHGKDLLPKLKAQSSKLKWRDRYLKYYEVDGVKIWLYDIVYPNEPFNVAFWKECADIIIADIICRHKLPIVVGGTGLYLKSLSQSLSQISVPPNLLLRNELANKGPKYLFNYLNKIDSTRAASLNSSDRQNPRRLIRALEISLSDKSSPRLGGEVRSYLQIGLTAPKEELILKIKERVKKRGLDASFEIKEVNIMKKQLVWFKKQPSITWFDISLPHWTSAAMNLVRNWYNNR